MDDFKINSTGPVNKMVDTLTNSIRKRNRLTATGIGVFHSDDRIELSVDGFRNRKENTRVSIDDKWHIGSVTKSITSTLIATLVEEGKLEFNSTLPDLLPSFDIDKSWELCTLHNLLTHTGGFKPDFASDIFYIRSDDPDELRALRKECVQEVMSKPSQYPPGSEFRYSNLGYTVAGLIAEEATNESYQQLLEERIFSRLGLESAGLGAPKGEQPFGHRVRFGFRKPMYPETGLADNSPIMSPAGGLHMSLVDLLRYGKEHLDSTDSSLLQRVTWDFLHQPNMSDYSCGWVVETETWAGGRTLWHNGSNTLWYSLLMLLPEKGSVLAFVTNDGAIAGAEKAFFKAAEQIGKSL